MPKLSREKIEEILKNCGFKDDDLKSLSYSEVLKLYKGEEVKVEDVLENAEEEKLADEDIDFPPLPTENGWTQHVLKQLENDELENGKPKCAGLRRLTEMLVGPIIRREVEVCKSPSHPNDLAVVKVKVNVFLINTNHPAMYDDGVIAHEEDVASCAPYNTVEPYASFQIETATTRADARCLKKLLRLNTLAAEEVGEVREEFKKNDEWEPQQPITTEQINLLDMMCSRTDIDVMAFINSGTQQYDDIQEISYAKGQKMLSFLTDIQRGERAKPEGLPKYSANWKEKE